MRCVIYIPNELLMRANGFFLLPAPNERVIVATELTQQFNHVLLDILGDGEVPTTQQRRVLHVMIVHQDGSLDPTSRWSCQFILLEPSQFGSWTQQYCSVTYDLGEPQEMYSFRVGEEMHGRSTPPVI